MTLAALREALDAFAVTLAELSQSLDAVPVLVEEPDRAEAALRRLSAAGR